MAHAAAVDHLVEELIQAVTQRPLADPSKRKPIKKYIIGAFADPKPLTTNHFEIQSKLSGLEEKFRIFNNDELADALRIRLDELSTISGRWTPEILSFLLQLSDRPLQNAHVESLELLKPPPPPVVLTWSDITANDPLDNKDGIWDNVDFAADDSEDDEDILPLVSSTSDLVLDPASDSNDGKGIFESVAVSPDVASLEDIIEAQYWAQASLGACDRPDRKHDGRGTRITLTETQIVRETASMLLGLPSPIYDRNAKGTYAISGGYEVRHMSQDSLSGILHEFGVISNRLSLVRDWVRADESIPFLQTLQAALGTRLSDIDNEISIMQARLLDLSRPHSTSLLLLRNEVQTITSPLIPFNDIVAALKLQRNPRLALQTLELLYRKTCELHSIGDIEAAGQVASVFFDCLNTYLRPIRRWMESGEIIGPEEVSFIEEWKQEIPMGSFWDDQYKLAYDSSSHLRAPDFLNLAAKRILNTGKSVQFLKKLRMPPTTQTHYSRIEPLDLKKACAVTESQSLSPFSEIFMNALDQWISSMFRSSTAVLRSQLETSCGLYQSIEALQLIYFFRNGALSHHFATTVFERMDRGKLAWNDSFLLTELVQNIFGASPLIDLERLSVRSVTGSHRNTQNQRRSVNVFESLRVMYILSWPVANIIKEESMSAYQRVFVLLMQVQRAKQMLERRFPRLTLLLLDKEDRVKFLTFSLRHRLLWFTNTVWTYLTEIVLSVSSKAMRVNMEKAEDLDEMIFVHQNFILHLQEQCLISKRLAPIHQAIMSMLDLVIVFSDEHARSTASASFESRKQWLTPVSTKKIPRSRRSLDTDSRSSDESEGAAEVDAIYVPVAETPYAERLTKAHETFKQLHSFVTAGLQGVSRAGGEPCWAMLADSLAAGFRSKDLELG
ncbi:MAG: hypothetical protein LQ351_005355 [Letrouitia transgressa]|nr:MAG: hypothetical protein LQ351_005355 [Letrouitia transgressa]